MTHLANKSIQKVMSKHCCAIPGVNEYLYVQYVPLSFIKYGWPCVLSIFVSSIIVILEANWLK